MKFLTLLLCAILTLPASVFAEGLKVEVKDEASVSKVYIDGKFEVPIQYLSDLNGCYGVTFKTSDEQRLLRKMLDIQKIEDLQKALQDEIVAKLAPESDKQASDDVSFSWTNDADHAGVREFVLSKVKACWQAADTARNN